MYYYIANNPGEKSTNGRQFVINSTETMTNGCQFIINPTEKTTNGRQFVINPTETMTNGCQFVINPTEIMTNWRPFVIDSVVGTIKGIIYLAPKKQQAAASLGILWRKKSETELIELLKHPLSGYRTAAAYALAHKKSISPETRDEIIRLKDTDNRPWVRLGAWKAYELLQKKGE